MVGVTEGSCGQMKTLYLQKSICFRELLPYFPIDIQIFLKLRHRFYTGFMDPRVVKHAQPIEVNVKLFYSSKNVKITQSGHWTYMQL